MTRPGSRTERGSGTVLASAVLLVVLALGAALLVYAGYLITAHRAAQAADVVALSGARAMSDGEDPCSAAERSARANAVVLAECRVSGDDLDFAVTVTVERAHRAPLPGLPGQLRARAVAGSLA